MNTVRTQIIRVGNSRGIRLPKLLIDQAKLDSEVEISVRPEGLMIKNARNARDGWDEQFRRMAARGDDRLLDPPTVTQWDQTEWKW